MQKRIRITNNNPFKVTRGYTLCFNLEWLCLKKKEYFLIKLKKIFKFKKFKSVLTRSLKDGIVLEESAKYRNTK